MNSVRIKGIVLLIGTLGMFGTLSAPILKNYGISETNVLFLFYFMFGVMMTGVVTHIMLENTYTVATFRLHGWRNGKYGVRLRIYSDGRIPAPHGEQEIFYLFGNNPDLPRSPDWRPYTNGNDHKVILCGNVFTFKRSSFDHEKELVIKPT